MKKKLAAYLLSATILCSGVTTAWAAVPVEHERSALAFSEHILDRTASKGLVNLALNPTGVGFPKLFTEYTNAGDNLKDLADGIISSKQGPPIDEGPRNRWTNYDRQETAFVEVQFETEQDVHQVELFAYNDFGGVPTPKAVSVQYWDGSQWQEAANQEVTVGTYENDTWIVPFTINFDVFRTANVRVTMIPQDGKSVGASELRVWGVREMLHGFEITVPEMVPGDNQLPLSVMLEEAKEQSQPVYIKMVDSAGAEQVFMEEIPANKQTADFSLDLTEAVEGRIQLTVSLQEDFSEGRTVFLTKRLSEDLFQSIYEEVKTPYEYGIVLSYSGIGTDTFDSDLIDNPNVFAIPGDDTYVYMTYVGHDGTGYRTGLARSMDMLHWEKVGKILENGEPGAWDEYNAAGYIVRDHEWGELPTPHVTEDGRLAMTYLASDTPGYEAGIKRAGVAFADSIFQPDGSLSQWERAPDPVLDANDGAYPYEKGIIWKLQAIWDAENSRYVGFYNAASGPEVMCQAYSQDLLHWEREATNPVLNQDISPSGAIWGDSHNADADVVKIGDYWVMFYFTSSPGGIIDSFAVSKDMVHWEKSYIPLTKRNNTYSSTYAHKPCVVKKNGVVYHYYNAVGSEGRLIALDTSIDLSALQRAQAISPEDCSEAWYQGLQEKVTALQTELRVDGGSLERIQAALQALEIYLDAGEEVESQLLTVQWSGNASMRIEGNAEEILSTDAIYGAKVQPGEELTFTFTPTEGVFSSAQLNGEDIKFGADGCTYTFTMPNESTSLRFIFAKVNKSILEVVLEQANAVPQNVIDRLVPEVKEFFTKARTDAQTVYDNVGATQEEVNKAWSDLLDAMHLLEFEAGDQEILLPLINIAEQLAERLDEFKPSTTAGFEEALEAAKEVYGEENPLKVDVDEAYGNLQAAIEKLENRADTSELQGLVDEANTFDLDSYIQDEAFNTFTKVLAEAEELLLNANADQADVDAKALELMKAMTALRKIPNKDELNKLIAEMEQKDLVGYTDRSVAAFKAALSVAKAVAVDTNADKQAVAKAYVNLEEAANGLVKEEKPGAGSSGSSKGSTSANVGNAYGKSGIASATQGVTSQQAHVVSDTTVNFALKHGQAYCFKMTVVDGANQMPSFTVGNGDVLKTQFVAKIGNDYYYRVYAIGTPGQSTGVYTTLPGNAPVKHSVVTIG